MNELKCFNRKCLFFDDDETANCSIDIAIKKCNKAVYEDSAPIIEVVDIESLICYIKEYEDGIFIRDGAKTVALKDLSNQKWAKYVAGFIEQGILPTRVKRQIEIINDK